MIWRYTKCIFKWIEDIFKWFEDIFNSFEDIFKCIIFMPPFEKGGAYCFAPVGRYVSMYVGMSVALNLVQLITQ